ncbi:TetR/AcrR family transcriptional regulator [Spirochaetota bacterium]
MKNGKNGIKPEEKILKAAKKEFAEKGFQGSRMAEIAKLAKVNKALIHYYFNNKDDLYRAVLERIFGHGKIDIPLLFGKWNLTAPQKLYVVIYFLVNLSIKASDPEVIRIISWEIAEGKKYLKEFIKKYIVTRQLFLRSVIIEGIESGDFESKSPSIVVMNLFSMIFLYQNLYDVIDIVEDAVDNGTKGGLYFKQNLLEQTVQLMFKILKPENKGLKIPEVPADLIKLLDELIETIKQKQDQGLTEEALKQLERILSL